MAWLKRTYSLPAATVEAFEREVPAGQRSEVLTRALGEWLEKQRRAQLRREVIKGCREMADIYLEVEKEFHPLEEEVARGLDSGPATRRRRTGSSRSRRGV